MNVSDNLMFSKSRLYEALRAHLVEARKEVDSVSKEQFLSNSDEQVAEYVFSKMEILPLTIYRDQAVLSEPREKQITRPGTFEREIRVTGVEAILSIPYVGETDLWKMQPSSFDFNPPRGTPEPQRRNDQSGVLRINFEYTLGEFSTEGINTEITRVLESIEQYLLTIRRDVEAHNAQLKNDIAELVHQRRQRLGNIQAVSTTLMIPIQRQAGAPDLSLLPLQKKIIPPLSTKPHPTEYAISSENYELILQVIRHEGGSFERTPGTFAKFDEEELRNIILAHLNSHYKGQANGETFRKKGKTDICIEFENRAAFVAECKLWKGDQILLEAVDQMLNYLTWKDVKTSLVVFNKDVAGFKRIQDKILDILRQHRNFFRTDMTQPQGEWRLIFRSVDDPDRLVTVHVFLFNLYVAAGS